MMDIELFFSLPFELYRYLLAFLSPEECLQWVRCNKANYRKLGRLTVRVTDSRVISYIPALLSCPSLQVFIDSPVLTQCDKNFPEVFDERLRSIVNYCSHKIRYVRLPSRILSRLFSPDFAVQEIREINLLQVERSQYSMKGLFHELSKVRQSIGLNHLSIDVGHCGDLTIPHFPSLKSLTIHLSSSLCPFSPLYYSQLQKVVLYACAIVDVSMLASVSTLELRDCAQIQDISALNHNLSVCLVECHGITDYSQSFEFTQLLEICVKSGSPIFDLTRWKRVTTLVLESYNCEVTLLSGNRIPSTVSRCELGGTFVALLDLSHHPLRYLHLHHCTVTSFAMRGLEKVSELKFSHSYLDIHISEIRWIPVLTVSAQIYPKLQNFFQYGFRLKNQRINIFGSYREIRVKWLDLYQKYAANEYEWIDCSNNSLSWSRK